MTEPNELPPLPWWQGREARKAARAERRRQRHDERDERKVGREASREGTRAPVTPERLADAALNVIDNEGLDGLTVRRLAQELGLGTMTLYWYVQNKDEVLDLVADRIVAGIDLPEPTAEWRTATGQLAIAVRRAMLRHGNAIAVMVGRGSLGPNGLMLMERALAVLRNAGFGVDEAADTYFMISNFVLGFCAAQASTPAFSARPNVDRRAYGEMLRQYVDSLPENQYPNLKEAAPRMFAGGHDERFAFALDAMLDGLEARLEAIRSKSA